MLKLTAEDLRAFGIADQVVPEPLGGAHLDPFKAAALLSAVLAESLQELAAVSSAELFRRRHERLRGLATFVRDA